jgi:hypothetical protein
MSDFASEETMGATDELETQVEAEPAEDAPSATAAEDADDWDD